MGAKQQSNSSSGTRNRFTDEDKALIESVAFFFIATADSHGRPDCSFKGNLLKSLGNIAVNPHVALLFLRIGEKPGRLRVNGTAKISMDDPLLASLPGAQLLVRVTPEHIFPNCPRYIPELELKEYSVYAPREAVEPVEPAWKSFDVFKDVVPPRRR